LIQFALSATRILIAAIEAEERELELMRMEGEQEEMAAEQHFVPFSTFRVKPQTTATKTGGLFGVRLLLAAVTLCLSFVCHSRRESAVCFFACHSERRAESLYLASDTYTSIIDRLLRDCLRWPPASERKAAKPARSPSAPPPARTEPWAAVPAK
jgi:hypothetical protein